MTEYDELKRKRDETIRRFRSEPLRESVSDDVKGLINDLSLLPGSKVQEDEVANKLTMDKIPQIIKECGEECVCENEMVKIRTEVGTVKVSYRDLPMIYICNDDLSLDNAEQLESMNKAAADVTLFQSMVKVVVDQDGLFIIIFLEARHEDETSFRHNIPFYLYQIIQATKELQERYNEYETFRIHPKYKRPAF